ncbi:hypothetical protein GGU11DRAFT_755372 [Lentinula aff. detonsa]|uniref:Uncharacterized protein n=1 Tax=Lentinula aff. detonsa TaxID=2804958 RepID=A0AA38KNP3_9AGAR|nr:hypothetical protein GGU10DRAFT_333959 [Lentinula aff. detonsa]KAJ3799150.1 hypothetical protein GGU11DRAFT_755372 [Lentinula aff. detonsa]
MCTSSSTDGPTAPARITFHYFAINLKLIIKFCFVIQALRNTYEFSHEAQLFVLSRRSGWKISERPQGHNNTSNEEYELPQVPIEPLNYYSLCVRIFYPQSLRTV